MKEKEGTSFLIMLHLNHVCEGISFFTFLKGEVTRGYLVQENKELYSEKQNRVLTFMRTPRELERVRKRTQGTIRVVTELNGWGR